MVIILWQNTTNLIVLLPFLPIINQGYYDDYEYIYIYIYINRASMIFSRTNIIYNLA